MKTEGNLVQHHVRFPKFLTGYRVLHALLPLALSPWHFSHFVGFVYTVTGEHPRLGAMDVCPFIPVRGVTMEECVTCAKELGHLLASELDIPVFLYGSAASRDYRKTVAQIRAGEYEALANRVSWYTARR